MKKSRLSDNQILAILKQTVAGTPVTSLMSKESAAVRLRRVCRDGFQE